MVWVVYMVLVYYVMHNWFKNCKSHIPQATMHQSQHEFSLCFHSTLRWMIGVLKAVRNVSNIQRNLFQYFNKLCQYSKAHDSYPYTRVFTAIVTSLLHTRRRNTHTHTHCINMYVINGWIVNKLCVTWKCFTVHTQLGI